METYPAIIVGAGQAGVAASYCLQQRGIDHLVLEMDRAFSDWHNHRWDSFAMNTLNWMNVLPGEPHPFAPDANRNTYGSFEDTLDYFEDDVQAVSPTHSEGNGHCPLAKGSVSLAGRNSLFRHIP